MLWLLVVNIDNPVMSETFDDIPVTVEHSEVVTQNQRSNQVLDGTDTVSVTVERDRSVLQDIEAENIVATADMRELYLESQVPIEVSIPGFEIKDAAATPAEYAGEDRAEQERYLPHHRVHERHGPGRL